MNNCKNCGGIIEFSPKYKGNVCKNCNSIFEIAYEPWFEKKIYDERAVNPRISDDEYNKLRQIKCVTCGATIALDKFQAQTLCPYCGNSEIIETKNKVNLLIDSIIPFTINSNEALDILKKKVKSTFFANKTIFNNLTIEDIHGVYINSFVFDMKSSSKYNGILRDTRIVRDKEGRNHTEYVNVPVSGNINCNMDNIIIEANSNLSQFEINQILPYDYNQAVKYKNDFMNGYILEYQNKSLEEVYKDVRNVLDNKIKEKIVNKHLAISIVTMHLDTTINDSRYNYSLLPVYFVNVKAKKKTHRIVMNGQTGKLSPLPKSGWKIFGVIMSIIAILLLMGILFNI